jgi:tRNA pseudouridine13 synthase
MRIARAPEDFVVDEIPLYPPLGEGAHTFVRVEKRLRTTEEVARALARFAGVPVREVGYAGRKDRVAVTRQWLSVPGLAPERARDFAMEGARVLEAVRHGNRLRTGHLGGNRFELVVRDLTPEQAAGAPAALAALAQRGIPNRFGVQRFGRDGANAERGRRLLAGESPGRDRRAARFWLSALQAEVFNAWLEARPLPIDAIEVGEIAFIHASGASFRVEDGAREAARAAAFEISASGPLFGTHLLQPAGAALARERAALQACGIPEVLRAPRGIRLRGARRPVRVQPQEVHAERVAADAVRLRFTLPPGSYATVLVGALFAGEALDDSPAGLAYPG